MRHYMLDYDGAYLFYENMKEIDLIESKIYDVRGLKVMLDYDLAALYKVETRALN